jgi:hypothetical protein
MKYALVLALFLAYPQATEPTARDYYNELYKAGGLDHMADEYVCFQDTPEVGTFFLFSRSDDIRKALMVDGSFQKLPKATQTKFSTDILFVRGYSKGIPFKDYDFYSKDGVSYVGDELIVDKNSPHVRIRLTIQWETLRFKRAVEFIGKPGADVNVYGKCERVSSDIRQHGN